MNKICLSMIVKDEAPIIKRCLLSVARYIDYYIICDTGSSDNTKEIIKETMDSLGIKGEIYDDEWVDFGHNRSLSLQRSYGKDCQWALVIDADDTIEGDLPIEKLNENYDCYNVFLNKNGCSWRRPQIFNIAKKNWKYLEPLHEFPSCDGESISSDLKGDYKWIARCEGNRNSNPEEKYKKDYLLLKKHLLQNPKDSRKQFYAAQSACDAGLMEIAEKEYLKRIDLGGWYEEIFYSWFRIGQIRWNLNRNSEFVAEAFLKAFEVDPTRVEPLCKLSFYYRTKSRPVAAFSVAMAGFKIKKTNALLFVEDSCYDWMMLDEIATTSFYAKRPDIGIPATEELLNKDLLPESQRERIKNNLSLFKSVYNI